MSTTATFGTPPEAQASPRPSSGAPEASTKRQGGPPSSSRGAPLAPMPPRSGLKDAGASQGGKGAGATAERTVLKEGAALPPLRSPPARSGATPLPPPLEGRPRTGAPPFNPATMKPPAADASRTGAGGDAPSVPLPPPRPPPLTRGPRPPSPPAKPGVGGRPPGSAAGPGATAGALLAGTPALDGAVSKAGAAAPLQDPLSPMPPFGPRDEEPRSGRTARSSREELLAEELQQRADRLREGDPVGAARALVELGVHQERLLRDVAGARRSYEGARQLCRTLEPALGRLRRLLEGPAELPLMLELIEDKLRVAEGEAARADLLAERARACEALGRPEDSREAFAEALRLVPLHAAALRGLEAVLRREIASGGPASLSAELAAHLERLADAYAPGRDRPDGDARLAAWIHVERAIVLDRKLGQPELSLAALDAAVSFDSAPGPVRDTLRRHLVLHDGTVGLVGALSVEADHEHDDERASRLLYLAARLLIDKLRAPTDAIGLLSRASARAPAATGTARRVLAELIRLLEASGALELAAGVRQQELALLSDNEAIVHEHVRLSELYDALGNADQAAFHAGRALGRDPEDASTRERLDRALQRLGHHEERVQTWTAVANADRPTPVRVAALLRASDIAQHHLKRPSDAIAYLRSAWAIDPGNSAVFDALSALLAPKPLPLGEDGAPVRHPSIAWTSDDEARGVRARIDLYAQAAAVAEDTARKIGLLEKLVAIWEDEIGHPARAIEEIEKILDIDPRRRTAILALQRNAARAGDAQRLVRALSAEADLTGDRGLERRLLLRAAELTEGRLGDRDRASALVGRALSIDPEDPEALRARFRIDERAGRYDDARSALLRLIGREVRAWAERGGEKAGPCDAAYALWIEVALLDERRLKRPRTAVDAYREAARIKPRHPLPRAEIARLLREIDDYDRLVEALTSLAEGARDPRDLARLLFQAAEVQEIVLGRDADALTSLTRADAALAEEGGDTAILEAMERIYVRAERGGAASGPRAGGQPAPMAPLEAARALAALYARWLERKPPPAVDHAIRVALAQVLAAPDPHEAIEILQGLIGVVPSHVPALRLLEQLHRGLDASIPLAAVLRAEAEVFVSSTARAGALWELCALEDQVGPSATLEALERIVKNVPRDTAALAAILRVAGKLAASPGIAPQAATAARGLLLDAIRASKELTADPIARALYNMEEALLAEAQSEVDASAARAALAGFRSALALWPESLLAARGLDRLAQRLGDRACVILAQVALAKLAFGAPARAGHLVRAAELTAEEPSPEVQARALDLYEEALHIDAECKAAARALARMLSTDPSRLIDLLGGALEEASAPEAVALLGVEIGRAVLRHHPRAGAPEPGVGIAAMRRVIGVTPDDPEALLLMARLLVVQRVWAEARDTLQRTVIIASDADTKVTAHFLLADLHEGPLADLPRTQEALQAVLSLDPKNRLALERLHKVGAARGDHAVVLHALGRLVELAPEPVTRAEAGMRLADACREAGDAAGVVRAICDAIASAPADSRAWMALARLYRLDSADGATAYVKALQQLIELAGSRRLAIEPRWLTTLGLLEVTVLLRPRDGLAHLQQATLLPGAPAETRTALGRGLEAAGRNSEAVQVLRDALSADPEVFARLPDLGHALSALDAALAKDGRAEERLAVEEVRACLGDVAPERIARLRTRRLVAEAPYPAVLAGLEVGRLLVPEARSAMIEVAVALSPIAAKAIRFELSNLGIGSRERVGPRDGHPTRLLAERIGRALGVEAFELYLAPTWQGAARVYPGDPPAIVAATSFVELPELEQAFALARLLSRVALGFTFLDEISIEAADGLLLAAVRTIDPGFASGELTHPRELATQGMLAGMQRAIGRRQRKLLEEIAQKNLSAAYDPRALTIGVRRSEYRIAYVLSGDALAAIDYLRQFDREIARSTEEPRILLQHPVTNELLRYALTAEAYAERRRAGTVWASV